MRHYAEQLKLLHLIYIYQHGVDFKNKKLGENANCKEYSIYTLKKQTSMLFMERNVQ